jgi:hypothetical protein
MRPTTCGVVNTTEGRPVSQSALPRRGGEGLRVLLAQKQGTPGRPITMQYTDSQNMNYHAPNPLERRPVTDPHRDLVAAVVEQAIQDLTCRHRILRTDAQTFVTGPGFSLLLQLANVQIGADQCRRALQRRGVLPS